MEDYFIVEVERFEGALGAERLLHDRSESLAQLLLGENTPLAQAEVEEALRTRFSYFADDLPCFGRGDIQYVLFGSEIQSQVLQDV